MFNVCAHQNNQKRVIAVGGEIVWYADPEDAKEKLDEAKAFNPGAVLSLDVTPLGRAFALSEGWMGPPAKETPPMRLQASTAVLKACGDAGNTLPDKIKERMNKATGAFPIFSMDELATAEVSPHFFTKEDLVGCWLNSGKSAESIPSQLTLSDLRVLIFRMLTEEADWSKVLLVPTQKAVELMEQIEKFANMREQIAANVAKAIKERDADTEYEPPPLT